MNTSPLSDRRLLAEELARSEQDLDLGRAALLIAREEYPQLPVELYLARLDQLSEEVADRLAGESAPPVVLMELLHTLFVRRGMRGNREAYHDPRNSFLNDVLDRGLGLPLTLGIVTIEVGRRLDLPLEGVNFPGHFLVRYRGEAERLMIDTFGGGKVRFESDGQALVDEFYGGPVTLQPSFLRTASKRDMLTRLLTNLKGLYIAVGDDRRALAVVERLLMIKPVAPDLRRARGVLLARMGRLEEAASQLEAYLRVAPSASDASDVEAIVRDLKSGSGPTDVENLL